MFPIIKIGGRYVKCEANRRFRFINSTDYFGLGGDADLAPDQAQNSALLSSEHCSCRMEPASCHNLSMRHFKCSKNSTVSTLTLTELNEKNYGSASSSKYSLLLMPALLKFDLIIDMPTPA